MAQTFVIVGHRGAHYAIDASAVREIVWLPELSPIAEMPAHIAGVFDLRGRVVPVVDLGIRFGHGPERRQASDRVVVIEAGGGRAGILVHELHDVRAIAPELVEAAGSYQAAAGGHARFVSGEARLDDGLAMVLDVAAVLRESPVEDLPAAAALPEEDSGAGEPPDGDAAVFRRRARDLAHVPESGSAASEKPWVIVRIGGESFGIDAALVREFAHLRGLTPIPCSPGHVAGNMNLRGDILIVIDIRPALGIGLGGAPGEVAVLEMGERRFGVRVEAIEDMAPVSPDRVGPPPVASQGAGGDCCTGMVQVDGRAVGLLDMERVLASPAMRVA